MSQSTTRLADGPILLRNTMRIKEGHLEKYRDAVRSAVDFVREHGPQLMVEVFIDEANLRAYSFQLYLDSAAVLKHWQLADPYIQEVMEHCSVEALDVYGQPSKEVMDGLTQNGGTASLVVTPHLTGFFRHR
ncbi:hypothetical protein E1165_21950 [Micromonospora sp. KC723]|nr:hypothetical protein E1165_21950 [Micromonospora sp. KC723]